MGTPLLQVSGDFSRARRDAWVSSIRMKKSAKKCAGKTETAHLKSTKGLALKIKHPEINIGNTRRNMSFYPRKDVTSKNFTSSLRPFN